ncbi:hypothetical protein BTM25_16130 [Actinomadura rubteroloni]|uniref:DUF4190 domain-containing protein n=1 Tax=Actinomadura rubteroloni TaxID=1926885 RepID=A0A2P4UQ77_9ACTN|nr:DUF456 domain-containing protein [Actinomadura rubteroloni]POM27202.1 hypothetical protein BTM25_16130 [Actinomadura rubteroloni]
MTHQAGPGEVQAPQAPPPGGRRGPASRRALWLAIGGLILAVPFWPLGLVLGIAGIVTEIRARRDPAVPARRGLSASIVVGACAVLVGLFAMTSWIVLAPELSDRQSCLDGANTVADKKACDDAFSRQIIDKFDLPPDTKVFTGF